MAEKLAAGDLLPEVTLRLTTGDSLTVPSGLGDGFRVILFYRGHW